MISKLTHVTDKTPSFEPIELKSGVVRMFILLVAFGFYMAFISVSRTWIPVAQTEPEQTQPVEVEHEPIKKDDVVATADTKPTAEEVEVSTEVTAATQPQPQTPEPFTAPKQESPQPKTQKKPTKSQGNGPKTPVAPGRSDVKPSSSTDTSKESGKESKDKNGPITNVLGGVVNGLDSLL